MKIAMPVDDRSMETSISQHFGRAPYFLIYDTGSKESMFLDNSAAISQGGAGIKAALRPSNKSRQFWFEHSPSQTHRQRSHQDSS